MYVEVNIYLCKVKLSAISLGVMPHTLNRGLICKNLSCFQCLTAVDMLNYPVEVL